MVHMSAKFDEDAHNSISLYLFLKVQEWCKDGRTGGHTKSQKHFYIPPATYWAGIINDMLI